MLAIIIYYKNLNSAPVFSKFTDAALSLGIDIENCSALQPKGLDFFFAEFNNTTRYSYNTIIYNNKYTHGNKE